jgi:hypothetical protein
MSKVKTRPHDPLFLVGSGRFDEGELEIGHSYYASSLLYPLALFESPLKEI